MNYSHILWDFNGTILDDTQAVIDGENALLARRSMPLLETAEQYRDMFCFPIKNFYIRLGYDFSRENYEDVADEWIKEYLRFAETSTLCPGVRETLDFFKTKGARQIIVSASEKSVIISQLTALGIIDEFDEIIAQDNLRGDSKTARALRWKEREKPQKSLFIGDTVHDSETARALGVDCVLIAMGHQSRKVLSASPFPVFDSLYDYLDTVR